MPAAKKTTAYLHDVLDQAADILREKCGRPDLAEAVTEGATLARYTGDPRKMMSLLIEEGGWTREDLRTALTQYRPTGDEVPGPPDPPRPLSRREVG